MRLLLLCILINANLYAQNLVPNPSFEDTVFCPTFDNQIYNSLGWSNFSDQSPDYFNSCTVNSDINVPNNWGGYQEAASGNAYIAISTFYPSTPNKREIIGRNLSTPLIIGNKYFFSMKVNLSISSYISSCYATNKLGVRFSTTPYNSTNPVSINNFCHIWTDSIITDTLAWKTVFGSFVADSSYNYLSIGNFFDDSNTDTFKITVGTPMTIFAYYYIDDVCVSSDSLYCQNYTYTSLNSLSLLENNFDLYPNPVSDFLNIESSILSENYFINLFELTGKLVLSQKLEFSFKNRVELKDIPNGVYLLQINKNGFGFNQKIVVNH